MRLHQLAAVALLAVALQACARSDGALSPASPSAPPAVAQTWLVRQEGDVVTGAYGSGTSFPQYLAFHTSSGYLRLVYGPSSGWATSIVVVPSLWVRGAYYQGAPTQTSWTSDNGALFLSFTATIAGLGVTGQIRVAPPAHDSVSATLTVSVSGSTELDVRPGEAFKPVALSTMHISSNVFDAQAVYVDSHVVSFPTAGWVQQPPVVASAFGVVGGSSSWKVNAPRVEIVFDRALPVTGWKTPTSDPNDDNVLWWNASDVILPSWQYQVRVTRQ